MKLLSLYIDSFGKLSNYKYVFDSKLNSINEENGWGKTTITVFIKSMLYGLDKNERVKYTPWKNLTSFGGSLVLEFKNAEYRIERTFDPIKPSLDTFKIYDIESNKEVDYKPNIGEAILNLNSSSFERSVFIPERELDTGLNQDLENKLQSLIGGTNEDESYDEAIRILSLREDMLKVNDKRGLISEKQKEINSLNEEIKASNDSIRDLPDVSHNIQLLDEEKEFLTNKKKDINNQIIEYGKNQEKLAKIDMIEKYDLDIKESEQALIKNNDIFNGVVVTQDEIINYRNKYKRLVSMRLEYEVIQKNTNIYDKRDEVNKIVNETNIPSDEELKKISTRIEKLQSIKGIIDAHAEAPVKKKPVVGIILVIVASLLLLAGLGLVGVSYFMSMNLYIIGYALMGASVFAYIGSLAGFIVTNQKNTEKIIGGSVKNYDFESNKLVSEIREFFSKYHLYSSDFTNNLFVIRNAKEKYLEWKNEYERVTLGGKELEENIIALDNDINHFLKQFKTTALNAEEMIGELNTHLRNQNDLFETLMKKREEKQAFIVENDLENVFDLNINLDDLNQELSKIDDELAEISKSKKVHIKRYNELQELQSYVDSLYEKRSALQADYNSLNEEYRLIKLSHKFLIESQESLLERYVKPMKDSINKYMKTILKNESEYNIDSSFKFKFKTKDGLRDIKEYSKGYQGIISLCMRLALIDCLYPKEKPFIILDDPFSSFDSEKLNLSLDLIKKISSNYQIIYYTCHDSREIK
ncbi:MAG: hypothetical protein IJR67_00285 [Acholeplasmatales bacterium]|nr:hypothetical protein [Acholeplasmatales bacterium]